MLGLLELIQGNFFCNVLLLTNGCQSSFQMVFLFFANCLVGPPLSPMDDEEGTLVYTGVMYLGSATVNAPRSETEISRNMAVLNEQTQEVIPVKLSVPATSEGIVRSVRTPPLLKPPFILTKDFAPVTTTRL